MAAMDVIVLDGNQRSSLAITRSLGRQGIKVHVGSVGGSSLASRSRRCHTSFLYPSPYEKPEEFIDFLNRYVANMTDAVLIPTTDVTVSEVLSNIDSFAKRLRIPFPAFEHYLAASNKLSVFNLAEKLRIPAPKSLFSTEHSRREILNNATGLGFPLVIKPTSSRIRTDHGWIDTHVKYANNYDELCGILEQAPFSKYEFLIQEKIEGPGMGIFVLMNNGEVLAKFAHRRIREKPPSGGVSVVCESIVPPPIAFDSALRLLRELNWFGVAMVEFKLDKRDNIPKLMEINARFWGSLQLAISAGVDFPFLLYSVASGSNVRPVQDYKVGLKSRWELGDVDHLLIRLFKKQKDLSLPKDAPSRLLVLADFLADFLRPSVRNEILRLDDPRPFVFELKQYIKDIIS